MSRVGARKRPLARGCQVVLWKHFFRVKTLSHWAPSVSWGSNPEFQQKASCNLIEPKESARILDQVQWIKHLRWLLTFVQFVHLLQQPWYMYFALISMPIGGANIGPMIGANMSCNPGGAASWPERRRATQSFPLQRTNELGKDRKAPAPTQ